MAGDVSARQGQNQRHAQQPRGDCAAIARPGRPQRMDHVERRAPVLGQEHPKQAEMPWRSPGVVHGGAEELPAGRLGLLPESEDVHLGTLAGQSLDEPEEHRNHLRATVAVDPSRSEERDLHPRDAAAASAS
jgi:hypothetical protein